MTTFASNPYLTPHAETTPASTYAQSGRGLNLQPSSAAYRSVFARMADEAYMNDFLPANSEHESARSSRDFAAIPETGKNLRAARELMEMIVDSCGQLRRHVPHEDGMTAVEFYEEHLLGRS